jgi:hypothetical protein
MASATTGTVRTSETSSRWSSGSTGSSVEPPCPVVEPPSPVVEPPSPVVEPVETRGSVAAYPAWATVSTSCSGVIASG